MKAEYIDTIVKEGLLLPSSVPSFFNLSSFSSLGIYGVSRVAPNA
jgi:hypothetical protein